jgi:nickel-dependent lactate racemase
MRVGIEYGREHLDVEVRDGSQVELRRSPPVPPLADPVAAVRAALENPVGFPALRRALTPDDHVVVVVEERTPHLPQLLNAVLEHLTLAHVAPTAMTLLCPPSATGQQWVDDLSDDFQDVRVEVHDPTDRKRLAYLATTRQGRRIYLNRTVVDADQVVVVGRRCFDPSLGYSGAATDLYPALSDEETRKQLAGRPSLVVPNETPWPARHEAAEVSWLLGAPFFVQIIEGRGDAVAHVVAGPQESDAEGVRVLNVHWRVAVARPADTVVASLSGDPAGHEFADLARALACAARVVRPQGRIVLLSQARPAQGASGELLRQADDPAEALEILRRDPQADLAAALQWADAVQQAHVNLLSGFDAETTEELFAAPLDSAGQVQRLLDAPGSCLFLPDAHKTLAVLDE